MVNGNEIKTWTSLRLVGDYSKSEYSFQTYGLIHFSFESVKVISTQLSQCSIPRLNFKHLASFYWLKDTTSERLEIPAPYGGLF